MIFSLDTEVEDIIKADELPGSMSRGDDEGLAHSVLEGDKDKLDEGSLIEEAINRNISGFAPDLLFDQMVSHYQMAKKIVGPKIIRLLAGYDDSYVEKNLHIPEFRKELRERIVENVNRMKKEKLLDTSGSITDKGVSLASLMIYMQELDHAWVKGFAGEKVSKKIAHYGEKNRVEFFKRGDRYKDIALRDSVRLAVKRGRATLLREDLKTYKRVRKGKISLVYALDASASMKGQRIAVCKRAGVALAFRALEKHDDVGVIVFSKEVQESLRPTQDFGQILKTITRATASKQTDFVDMLTRSIELFPKDHMTKHLLVMTDALPTSGDDPEKATLKAVSIAKDSGITVSIIGIGLDGEGARFAQKCVELGDGRLYMVRNLADLDRIVLEDYASVM